MNLPIPTPIARCGVCSETKRLDIERNPLAHLTSIRCGVCGRLTLSMDKFERPLDLSERAKAS